MSFRTLACCGPVVGLALALIGGCSGGPARVAAPSLSASGAAAKAMEQYDANHDGKLSDAELDACPSIKSALAKIDTNGDKTVTAEKLTARIQSWQGKGITRMGIVCTVTRGEEPLAGAEVKFVPEKFMGSNFQPGTGKTDQNGKAAISLAEADGGSHPGLPLGYYRVEITKSGEQIPAKYNTETTLGQEVAPDNPVVRSQAGVAFDLNY